MVSEAGKAVIQWGLELAFDRGYAAGLDAAHEAVAALLPSPGDHPWIDLRDALAAIDALREGKP